MLYALTFTVSYIEFYIFHLFIEHSAKDAFRMCVCVYIYKYKDKCF